MSVNVECRKCVSVECRMCASVECRICVSVYDCVEYVHLHNTCICLIVVNIFKQ